MYDQVNKEPADGLAEARRQRQQQLHHQPPPIVP